MKDNSLRLRLVVRRHSLPEVRIIHHVPLENDPTIAELVDQINEIIPLESPEWGLEDYVVELRNKEGYAFECLHFQQVANVLKDEEEVFVRPLVTGDRKRRLLSGREQISNDGRHLIDGVPFGRPRLRSPRDRPPVDIPPLKRRRIEYDTIEHDDEQAEPLFLTRNGEGSEDRESTRQVRFNNAGFDANEDEEEDDDFVDQEQYGDEEGEDEAEDEDDDYEINPDELAEELEGLRGTESREETPADEDNIEQPADISPTKSQKSIDLSDIDRIAALRAAFPRVSVDVCEKLLLQHDSNERKVYWKLRRRNRAHMTVQQMLAYKRRLQVQGPEAAMEDELEAEASEQSDAESVASLVKHYDEHGFPAGSVLDGSANRHMVETLRMSGQDVKLPVHKKFDDDDEEDNEGTVQPAKVAAPTDENEIPLDSEEDGSEADLDFDEDDEDLSEKDSDTSDGSDAVSLSDEAEEVLDEDDLNESSDEGSAASDSESGPEVYTTKVKPPAEMVAPKSPQPNDESSSSDESDSDSNSDDDRSSEEDASSNESDSEDEEDDSRGDDSNSSDSDSSSPDNANANSDNDNSSDSESDSSDSSDDDSDDEPVTSNSKHANITKAVFQPISQQSGTLDTATLEASTAPNDQLTQGPVPPGQGKNKTRMRNQRRRLSAKMRKTVSRDTSIIGSTSAPDAETSTPADLEAKRLALLQSLGHLEYLGKPAVVEKRVEKPAAPATEIEKPEPFVDATTTAPAKRKTKLDVDAGRRMLFGSLGLKNPKSQEDEEKIRASLMKGVKPLVNHRVEDAKKDAEVTVSDVDSDAWRQKINYTAVECVEEGIELSEPPFPFYQRWDPRQQSYWGSGRGGPSKRKQQNQEEYEEEESGNKKRKVSDEEETVVLNYDEEDPDAYAAQDHHEEEKDEEEYDEDEEYDEEEHEDDEEDLPPLPADLATLPLLQPGQAKAGMVITWKQFLLSKATNWQPQVMNMTGSVVEVWDQNDLRILLAKRDRNLDVNEKVYDDDGNRVYDKFEVPEDEDDGDEDAEKGYRTINFADMMEPRVLRRSDDEVLVPETQHQGNITPATEDVDSKASSRTLDHKVPSEPESQIQESFIPDTNHGSSSDPQAAQVTSDGNVSIVDDLRQETSLIGTGSRPEASASVSHDEHPNVSNPSPQPETAPESPSSPQHGHSAPPSEGHNTPPRSSVLGDELPDVPDLPSQEHESQDQRPPSRSSAYLESQRITLEPFNGFSDGLEQAADNRGSYVSYARFDVIPSDTGSVRSGRQPDPEFSIDLGNNEILDRVELAEEDDVPMMGRDDEDDVPMAGSDREDDDEENDQNNEEEEHEDIEEEDEQDIEEGDQQDIEEDEQEDNGEGSRQSTPRPQRTSLSEEPASPALSDMSASTDDSFPSLSQTTTKSSQRRASQQPKSTPRDAAPANNQTRKSLDAANRDCEQTMKRLDEEKSSQESTTMDDTQIKLEKRRQLSELAQKLSKTPIERPAQRLPFRRTSTPSKLNQTTTATTKSTRATRFSGSFVIPEGAQVVELLSSSPEPELNEDYADDDVDETYHDSSPGTSQSQHRAPPSTAPNASASFSTPRRNLFSSTRLSSTQVAASPRRSQPSIITGSLRKNRGSASSSK